MHNISALKFAQVYASYFWKGLYIVSSPIKALQFCSLGVKWSSRGTGGNTTKMNDIFNAVHMLRISMPDLITCLLMRLLQGSFISLC